ncbi:MAG: MASE1 domain-containing protein [Deltaproteobacteria bacterium]|nr:MASE1 domain-containing protein [Deltaproteobacteria bacterium]
MRPHWFKVNLSTFFQSSRLFLILGNLLGASVYLWIADQSLKLASINSHVSPVWPPTGFAISLIFFAGRKYLPAVFLGAWLANYLTPSTTLVSTVIAIGNTLEAFLGIWIIEKIRDYKYKLDHLHDPISITLASLLAPIISTTLGVLILVLNDSIPLELMPHAWFTWWMGDAIGALLILPIIFSVKSHSHQILWRHFKKAPQKITLITGAALIYLTLIFLLLHQPGRLKFLFLVFPILLILSSLRNHFFIYVGSALVSILAIVLTVIGKGPFTLSTENQNLLNLEIFVVAISLSAIVIANISRLPFQNRIRNLLLIGWGFWGLVFYSIQLSHESIEAKKFQQITNEIEIRISEKMNDYIEIINTGRSLYYASESVEKNEWKTFVGYINLKQRVPGILGLGTIFKENSSFDLSYVSSISNEPQIIQVSPSSKQNLLATANEALVSGEFKVSKRMEFIQENKKQMGYLILSPVYKTDKIFTSKIQRTNAFSHWVFAPFIFEDFLKNIFEKFKTEFVFQIYDTPKDSERPDLSENNLIFKSSASVIQNPNERYIKELLFGGNVFFIQWTKSKEYAGSHDFISTWIGFIGAISTLFILLFLINIQLTGEKAFKLANKLYSDFLNSQEKVRKQESKIVESSKMASLGEMASSIAHEINNPLSIINGKAYQIVRHCSVEKLEDQRNKIEQDANKILSTVDRIVTIIKGLRQISRDASNDPMKSLNMDLLVEETLSFCKHRFYNSDVQLRVQINFHQDLICRGTEISQVLLNLLNNSFDAVINLPEKWVEIKVDRASNWIEISITDSGSGISKEIQNKIFQPFFTTKEVGKGTGLGLSISKGIIESHQGQFFLDETSPHTRFVIRLPLPEQAHLKIAG